MHSRLAPLRRSARRGFTLIELLTVIAIIGILAAIIVPTVGKVRNSAKKSQCLSRLRQWGNIVTLCSNDYKGNIPLFWGFGNPNTGYDPYITTSRAMIVEEEKDGFSRALRPSEAMAYCPTGINGGNTLGARHYAFVVPIGLTEKRAPMFSLSTAYYYRQNEAASPSQLLLMIEANTNSQIRPMTTGGIKSALEASHSVRHIQTVSGFTRHGGIANALFLDGHVASLTLNDTDYTVSSEKLDRWFTLR